jgi:ribonuclease R
MSGVVHLSSIENDFYVFDPARNNLVGRRSRRVIQLGDKLTVQVFKVDTFKRQVDFRLTNEMARGKKPNPVKPMPTRNQRTPGQKFSGSKFRRNRPTT